MPGACADTSGDYSTQILALSTEVGPYLRALARRFGLDDSDSADALQDALLAFCLNRFRIEQPRRWLRVVLKHECLRRLHTKTSGAVSLDVLGEARIAQHSPSFIANVDARLRVDKVLSEASPRNRRVLWMRFLADMSWSEIAQRLGCKPSGAKKAVHRAVAAVRESASAF